MDLSTKDESETEKPGVWAHGKDLVLELDEGSLKLIEPDSGACLNSQPIHAIRVWGVGRDNGKDFAYVSRDKVWFVYFNNLLSPHLTPACSCFELSPVICGAF